MQGAHLQPLPGAGVTLTQRRSSAGVRLSKYDGHVDRLSATNASRIGILVILWTVARPGFTRFSRPVNRCPERGSAEADVGFWRHTVEAPACIPALENAGAKDEMLMSSGQKNPNIEILGEFDVLVPADIDPERLPNVDLELSVDPDINLQLSVYIGDIKLGPYQMIPHPTT